MSDLIDRKQALDAIKYAELGCEYEAIEELPSAQQEWIPCSERLPKEGQGCLVCDHGTILIDTFLGHGNPYNWKWYTRDYEAWMPLPKPYGGERE